MSAARPRRSRNGRSSAREKATGRDGPQTAEVERLKRENERLREELAKRDRQIADLERQLALRQQNSTTSSKPPSSDGLAGRPSLPSRTLPTRAERAAECGGRRVPRRVSPLSLRWQIGNLASALPSPT